MARVDAIYARQSVDKADSISIESQIEFCKYETRGAPYRVFQDKGYSGKNTERPEFQQMLSAIRAGEIGRVICYKLDRCSRSILDFATLMEELQRYDVEFVSCTEKFDTSTPMGRAMLNICIVFAQLERETIQQRVLDAYHSRNIKGFYMGGRVPFGFQLESCFLDGKKTRRYGIIEPEAQILQRMYSVYSDSETSYADVVRDLAVAGIPNPRREDGRWIRSHIGRVLHNPIYVKADLEIYRYFKENGVIIHNPPEDFIGENGCYFYSEKDSEGQHLVLAPSRGIVSSDVWLQCRRKRAGNRKCGCPQKAKNTWLAGKIKCAQCGYAVVVKKTVKPGGKEFRYFLCSNAGQTDTQCSGIHSVKADRIEAIVYAQICKKCQSIPLLSPKEKKETDPDLAQLTEKIMHLEDEIQKTASKALEASGTLLRYLNDHTEELNQQKNEYIRRMKEMKRKLSHDSPLIVSNYMSKWPSLTVEDKRKVVDSLIHEIHLSQEEMTIKWKL